MIQEMEDNKLDGSVFNKHLQDEVGQMPSYFQKKLDSELQRLYDWLREENREPANTKFTSGMLRNVAREFEYLLSRKNTSLDHTKITDIEFGGVEPGDHPDYANAYIVKAKYNGVEMTEGELDQVDSGFVHERLIESM